MSDPERPRTTPEGHTPEEPRPGELGKPGTPGAGMTSGVPHAADARTVEAGEEPPAGEPIGEAHGVATGAAVDDVPHHAADSHIDAHAGAGDDDHAHAEPRVGPIDWPAWAFALAGVVVALVIVAFFFVAVYRPAG